MRQFLNGTNSDWSELEARATGRCVRYRDQETPPGATPDWAHVGFEIVPRTKEAILYVQYGVAYSGNNQDLRSWFESGEKRFPSFQLLREWVQGPLADVFDTEHNATLESCPVTAAGHAPSQITNMTVVNAAVQNMNRPLYLDEAALHQRLRDRVLGQDDALRALAAVIVRHCARPAPRRPAVIFAVGPSGVGKTRSAEVLPGAIRELANGNNGYQFLRLDMTEYQEAHRVSQLIGAPQGYVGHGDGSQLIDTLRANPHTIILFDEIEKAHPAILRVLMNAMDAGRLSTSARLPSGRDIDCRRAVFLFTSNLDSKEILDELGDRDAFGNRSVEDEVCRRRLKAAGVAPEIVGRIGRFLVYRPLSSQTRAEILALSIVEVAQEYGIKVAYIEPDIIVNLMEKLRSDDFGVRPERFLIDDVLGSAFAKAAAGGLVCPIRICGEHPYRCETHDRHPLKTPSPNQPFTEMRSPKPEQGDPTCPAR